MTILTVDDDVEDQEFFAATIAKIDPSIICLTANDGIEGYEMLFGSEKYCALDYVFLDINMPKMNGLELLVLIKKDERRKNIPVYVLSTSCSTSDTLKINLLGATLLEKQSQFKLNIAMLKSALEAKPVIH